MTLSRRTGFDWAVAVVLLLVLGSWLSGAIRVAPAVAQSEPFGYTTSNVFWLVSQFGTAGALLLVAGAAGLGTATSARRLATHGAFAAVAGLVCLAGVITLVQIVRGVRTELFG